LEKRSAILSSLHKHHKVSKEKCLILQSPSAEIPLYCTDNLLLLVMLLFSEVSSYSSLVCSPDVNFRQVSQSNFQREDSSFHTTLEKNGFDKLQNNTFQQGTIHLIGFKKTVEERNPVKHAYRSISKVDYQFENEVKKNVTVDLENVFVNPLDNVVIEELESIFNVNLSPEETLIRGRNCLTFNYPKLFSIFRCFESSGGINKTIFEEFWKKLEMPNVTNNLEEMHEIISRSQQWFSFLTSFRLTCVEGNHRLDFFQG